MRLLTGKADYRKSTCHRVIAGHAIERACVIKKKFVGHWAFPLQTMKCHRRREEHANAEVINSIAT